MSDDDIAHVNLAQSICLRPRMYTRGGTLAEVYTLLTDDDQPQPVAGSRDNASVRATVAWLQENAHDPENIVTELLEKHGSDSAALDKIAAFASTLPAET